jgi:hypothetical protein
MSFCLLPEAEADLDDIWFYVARASGSIEIANRLIRVEAADALILHVMRGSRDIEGLLNE